MTRLYRVLMICLLAAAASGCATITGSELQSVAISAKSADGKPVEKADCDLKNDKGQWKGATPGFVQVLRSSEDLLITCTKVGQPEGMMRAISRAAGGMFGNIIFGGGIGALIDHNKGTGYNYPDTVVVEMGKSGVRDRNDERDEQQQKAGQPGTAVTSGDVQRCNSSPDRDVPTSGRC
jgi:hypothetical protein